MPKKGKHVFLGPIQKVSGLVGLGNSLSSGILEKPSGVIPLLTPLIGNPELNGKKKAGYQIAFIFQL